MSELFSIQLQNRQQQGRDGVWLDLPTTTEPSQPVFNPDGTLGAGSALEIPFQH